MKNELKYYKTKGVCSVLFPVYFALKVSRTRFIFCAFSFPYENAVSLHLLLLSLNPCTTVLYKYLHVAPSNFCLYCIIYVFSP